MCPLWLAIGCHHCLSHTHSDTYKLTTHINLHACARGSTHAHLHTYVLVHWPRRAITEPLLIPAPQGVCWVLKSLMYAIACYIVFSCSINLCVNKYVLFMHIAYHIGALAVTCSHSCPMSLTPCNTLQCTATHCNALQHTAMHCNTLQNPATHCSMLQHTATHCSKLRRTSTLQHTATQCGTLQHTATHCRTLQHIAACCNILQHIAANCDALTHCSTL